MDAVNFKLAFDSRVNGFNEQVFKELLDKSVIVFIDDINLLKTKRRTCLTLKESTTEFKREGTLCEI